MSDPTSVDAAIVVDPVTAAADHFAEVRSKAAKAVEEAIAAEEAKNPPKLEPSDPGDDPEAPDEPLVARRASADDEPDADGADGEAAPGVDPKVDRSIARILKQRDKAAVVKTDAQKALEEARAAVAEAKEARAALAKERAEVNLEKAKIAKLKNVQNAPEALRELGWEPEDFITAAARAKTPEGRLEALILAQNEEIHSLKAKAEGWEKQGAEQKAAAEKAADDSRIKTIETNFIKTAIDPDKYPSLAKRYAKPARHLTLLFEAHNVAREYRLATGGDEADFDQIAKYLEDEENGDVETETETEDASKQKKASTKGKATQAGKPPGKRTLTSSDSSERRSVPTVEKIDDLDELRRRARIASEKAIRESAG